MAREWACSRDVLAEMARTYLSRSPSNPIKELPRLDFERSGQLGERVDLGNPPTPLKQPDLGAVERGSEGKLLLSDA